MANRNIAFTITLNGTEQVFNSIAELEQAIQTATRELKTFTGSEQDFKKLQEEIKKANTELNKVKESTRGLSTEKQIGEFLKFGQVVTAAFGAATTALSLFGRENTDITEAAAKAQQILTLQFSLVTLAKEKDTIKTVLNTAATIANTLATQGLVAATRVLYALIKTNPLGALLTVISLVVSAIVLFKDSTEDAAKAEEDFQKVLKKGQTERQRNIQLLQSQGKTEVEIAKQALENAEDRFRFAQFYYLNTSRQSANFNAVEEEYDTAKFERTIAQNNLEQSIARANKENDEDEQSRKKALEEQDRKRLERLREELNFLIELSKRRTEIFGMVVQPNEQEEVDANIVKNLKERIEKLKQLKVEQENLNPSQERFNKLVDDLNSIVDDEGAVKLLDLTFNLEKSFKKLNDSEFITENNLKKVYGEINSEITNLIESNGELFDKENQQNILGYGENLQKVLFAASEINKVSKNLVTDGFLNKLRDLQIEIQTPIPPGDPISQKQAIENLEELKKQFINTYSVGIFKSEDYQKKLKIAREIGDSAIKELNDSVIEGASKTFDALNSTTNELLEFRKGITGTYFEVGDLIKELTNLSNVEIFDKLSKQMGLLSQMFNIDVDSLKVLKETLSGIQEQISKGTFDPEKIYGEEVLKFEEFLSSQRIDISKLTYEQKLKLLEQFLSLEVEQTEDAEQKKQQAQQKTIDKILEQIAVFQQALQVIQQTASDFYQFQFDQLEKRNKRVQDSIVGNSRRANELRLEQDKAYLAERERLEKKQAKLQLRLSLAQTIANVAQAVAQSLGTPVLAAIVAAAGAVQIGLITQQIGAVDSYKRGGRIKKSQGGWVTGPSHENGGVKFQGGGVELEGNEAVINRLSSLRYSDILSSINMEGGGRPIVMNNFDDSRIVEAIARQRSTPIRAYVVESDITSSQTINKRLELLSQI